MRKQSRRCVFAFNERMVFGNAEGMDPGQFHTRWPITMSRLENPLHGSIYGYSDEQDRMMASGWAPDSAVQDQIDDSIKEEVMRARARLPAGMSKTNCAACGEEIPQARRSAMPGARTCVACQAGLDRHAGASGYNRRGNKDSQLK